MRSVMLGSYDELMVAEKFVSTTTTCCIPAQQIMLECQGPPHEKYQPFGGPLFLLLLPSVTRLFSHHFLALIVHLWGRQVSTVGARRDAKIVHSHVPKQWEQEKGTHCVRSLNASLWQAWSAFAEVKLHYRKSLEVIKFTLQSNQTSNIYSA